MKKGIFNLVLALTLVTAGITAAKNEVSAAGAQNHKTGWEVSYNGKNDADFSSNKDDVYEEITGVMPGDTITYSITYKNNDVKTDPSYSKESAANPGADFYMNANVVDTLESGKDKGGAYSYVIKNNGKTLVDSQTVGGETGTDKSNTGLAQVCGETGSYFSLGNVPYGSFGIVTVSITLDGDSQTNMYGGKDAGLEFFFRAESKHIVEKNKTIIKTVTKTNTVTETIPVTETRKIVKQIKKTLDNGTEIVEIDESGVPLAGEEKNSVTITDGQVPLANPQTGDSMVPIIICGVMFLLGIALIGWYIKLMIDKKKEVA